MSERVGTVESDAPDNEAIAEMPDDARIETEVPRVTTDNEEADMMRDAANQELEPTNREKNVELLEEYYGDQWFIYGSHEGTISTIIGVCPAIQGLLDNPDGFRMIVTMFDGFKADKPEEDTTEKDEDKKDSIEEEAVAKDKDETPGKEASAATAENRKAERKTSAPEVKADGAQTHEATPTESKTDTKTSIDPAAETKLEIVETVSHTPEEQPVSPASVVETTQPEETPPAIEAAQPDHQEILGERERTEAEEGAQTAAVLEASPESELESTSKPTPDASTIEMLSASEEHDETPGDDLFEQVLENALDTPEEAQEEEDEPEEKLPLHSLDTPIDNVAFDDTEDHSELPAEVSLETQAEAEDAVIVIPQSELLEQWRALGEQQAPIEVTLTSIVEHVNDILADTNNEPSSSEIEPPKQEELFTAFEVKTVLHHVSLARRAAERLQTATTKEECALYIQELTREVTHLLELLGYPDPAQAIELFLSKYPVRSLHELLEHLETSLRQAIERAPSYTATPVAQKHTSLLAQLAMRVVQLFSPQYETA